MAIQAITWDRVLHDLQGVITEVNSITDINDARDAVAQIRKLVKDQTQSLELNARGAKFDHALHELLASMDGKIKFDNNGKLQTYSLKAQAKAMGRDIFRTHDIREEINKRIERGDLTRDEFYNIYQQGYNISLKESQAQEDLFNKYKDLIDKLNLDQNGNSLTDRLNNNNQDKIAILEEMRQNALKIADPEIQKALKKFGFDKRQITTDAQADKFNTEIAQNFMVKWNDAADVARQMYASQQQNCTIFREQAQLIDDERAQLAMADPTNLQAIVDDAEKEKQLRAKQIDMSLSRKFDKQYADKWNTAIRRFNSHKIEKNEEFIFPTGQRVRINYMTMDTNPANYPEYADDANFLNLDDYKEYLELTSKYDALEQQARGAGVQAIINMLNDGRIDKYKPEFASYFNLSTQNEKVQWIESYINQAKEYVRTFHGHSNMDAVRAETLRTAGTMFKSMKPISKDLPTQTRVANGVENFFRFFLVRNPFPKDENGKRKLSIPTAIADAAVIGGVAATAVFAPVALPAIGIGYAARGVVGIANKIAGKIKYNRHKEDIENNLPICVKPTRTQLEVKRQDYYLQERLEHKIAKRQLQGKSTDVKPSLFDRASAWGKAVIRDRIPIWGWKKGLETEALIGERQKAISNLATDVRTQNALYAIDDNEKIAIDNQAKRVENAREELYSAESYNDMVTDSSKIDLKDNNVLDSKLRLIARNAAIRTNATREADPDLFYQQHRESVNPDANKPISTRYTRDINTTNVSDLESDFMQVHTKGQTATNTVFTEGDLYKAEQRFQDRANRVWTTILTIGGKIGLDYYATKFRTPQEDTFVRQTGGQTTPQNTQPQSHLEVYYEYPKKRGFTAKDISSGKDSDIGLNDVYGVGGQISKSKRTLDVDAVALRIRDKNGNVIGDASFAESSTNLRALGEKVPQVFAKDGSIDISHMTYEQVGEVLKATNPVQFKKYVESIGLPADAPMEKIMRYAIRKGDLFTQTKALEGWRQVSTKNLGWVQDGLPIRKTRTVIDSVGGTTNVTTPGHTIVTHSTKNVFDPSALAHSAMDGAVVGAAMSLADSAQEAAQPTKKVRSGSFAARNKFVASLEVDTEEYLKQQRIAHEEAKIKAAKQKKQNKNQSRGNP